MQRRVTLRDVATELGLTKATVSRALNGYRDISPATVRRVRQAAASMGYRPLAQAQSIRTGQSRSLGLVLQMEQHDAQRPFLAEFLRGITRAVSAQNWTLTMATAESEQEGLDTYLRLIDERKADGFILPRTQTKDPRVDLLRRADCPFILYGRTDNSADCAWFDIRGGQAMRHAVEKLAALGHRHIAFIGAEEIYTYAWKRLDGYRAGIDAAGLTPHITAGHATADHAGHALVQLLDSETPPTGVICATDLLAIGAVRAAQARGLRVGHDISVIGYDGTREGQTLVPPLTSFAVDQVAAGARLAELLIARIGGADPTTLRETADATLREGGTVGPPPND